MRSFSHPADYVGSRAAACGILSLVGSRRHSQKKATEWHLLPSAMMRTADLLALESLVAEAVSATMHAQPNIDLAAAFFARAIARKAKLPVPKHETSSSADAATQCQLPFVSHMLMHGRNIALVSAAERGDDYVNAVCPRIEQAMEEALCVMVHDGPVDGARSVEVRLALQLLHAQGIKPRGLTFSETGTQCARPIVSWGNMGEVGTGIGLVDDRAPSPSPSLPAPHSQEESSSSEDDDPSEGKQSTGFKIALGSVTRDDIDDARPEAQPHTPKEQLIARLLQMSG